MRVQNIQVRTSALLPFIKKPDQKYNNISTRVGACGTHENTNNTCLNRVFYKVPHFINNHIVSFLNEYGES